MKNDSPHCSTQSQLHTSRATEALVKFDKKAPMRLFLCGDAGDGKSTLLDTILRMFKPHAGPTISQHEEIQQLQSLHSLGAPCPPGLLSATSLQPCCFCTKSRLYIVTDTPGDNSYTPAMTSLASHAEAALIIVDATRIHETLLPQTIKHSYLASLFGIGNVVFAINKMDRCGYKKETFTKISSLCDKLISKMGFQSAQCIPVSGLQGDNLCTPSTEMPWFNNMPLLPMLDSFKTINTQTQSLRLPVAEVLTAGERNLLTGMVIQGNIHVGQRILAQPCGNTGTVKAIFSPDDRRQSARAGDTIQLELDQTLPIGPGEILVDELSPLEVADTFSAQIVWFGETALAKGRSYKFQRAFSEAKATILELPARIEPASMDELPAAALEQNEIGRIKIALDRAIPFSAFTGCPKLGSFWLLDRISGNVLGAGMIQYAMRRSHNIVRQDFELNKKNFAEQKKQTPFVLWFTGLSASGKSSLSNKVAIELYKRGYHLYLLDGDNLRHGLNKDLGFNPGDRAENIRRAGEVARLMVDAGLIVLASFITPFAAERDALREYFGSGEFHEIFMDTPLEECIRRDPKGLYKKALSGSIPNYTGISSPYEAPTKPDLKIDGMASLDHSVECVLQYLETCCLNNGKNIKSLFL